MKADGKDFIDSSWIQSYLKNVESANVDTKSKREGSSYLFAEKVMFICR